MSVALPLFAGLLIGIAPSPTAPHRALDRAPDRASPVCIAPEYTGTFRLTAARSDGTQPLPAMLLLENIDGCLEATFVTDDRSPAMIDHLSLSGDTLKGSLNVSGNPAQVTFRFSGRSVTGTIVGRHREWRVDGKRTS